MKIFKKICICVLSCLVFVFALFSYKVYADNTTESLHKITKIYSSNNSDYYSGCEDNKNYRYKEPAITVLTHGFNGNASHWTNVGEEKFAYNSESLIAKIEKRELVDIYVAKCLTQTSFSLFKYDVKVKYDSKEDKYVKYFDEPTEVARINDASKHIVLVFESGNPSQSNDYVYSEFDYVIDSVSLQYKSLTGELPRLNLVGHSRGGITNIMYATEHPYNVANIYSLGTPYNGSVLGGFDGILDVLEYGDGFNEDGSKKYLPGVESLLSKAEATKIRDNWNAAYKSDVNIHVIALGSATAVEYIEAFVKDIADNDKDFGPMVEDYVDLVSFIVYVIKSCPNLTELVVDGAEGLANILNIFNINVYDEVIKKFNEEWAGSLTVEEGNKILELYQVVNGEAVLLDDLFIDLNSQFGFFDDGNHYKGFNRYLKIFRSSDLSNNRSCNAPAVVHNLEAMNEVYTNFISNDLVYGKSTKEVTKIEELGTYQGQFLGEKVLEFSALASGKRKITANVPFEVVDKNGLNVDVNNGIVDLKDGHEYYIVLKSNELKNATVSMDVVDEYTGTYKIDAGENHIFCISNRAKGYYVFNSYGLKFYDLSFNEISYIYTDGKTKKYVIAKSDGSTSNSLMEFVKPNEISRDGLEYEYGKLKLVCLENNYKQAVRYEITTKNTNIKIYDENNNLITSNQVSKNGEYTFSFVVESGKKAYICFDKATKAKCKVAEDQLFWFVDNKVVTNGSVELMAGTTTQVLLKLSSNEVIAELPNTYVLSNNGVGVTRSGYMIIIESSAKIGKTVTISHTDYANLLEIKIIPSKSLTITVNNLDVISFTWKHNSQSLITRTDWNLISSNRTISISSTTLSYSISSSQLSSLGESFKISLTRVYFEDGSFAKSYFNTSDVTVNGYYKSGSGKANDPYLIACQRHLQNISKHNSAYFKLTSSIMISNWTPFDFYGTLDGASYYLRYLELNCNGGVTKGLVGINKGTIKNIYFTDVKLTSTDEASSSFGGIVAGVNYGTITGITINRVTLDVQTSRAQFGGIVGKNEATIANCNVYSLTLTASGYAGGIAGNNTGSGSIENCYVSGNITYVYRKPGSDGNYGYYNGEVGGICGYSCGTISKCKTYGHFDWNSNNNNRDIHPCLGKIIGNNDGAMTDCESGMGYNCHYYYWYFIGWYDQSQYCFKIADGKCGA